MRNYWKVIIAVGILSVMQYWVRSNVPETIPCIPADAVDYDGSTNSWKNSVGEVLLYSPAEDTYEWCN